MNQHFVETAILETAGVIVAWVPLTKNARAVNVGGEDTNN